MIESTEQFPTSEQILWDLQSAYARLRTLQSTLPPELSDQSSTVHYLNIAVDRFVRETERNPQALTGDVWPDYLQETVNDWTAQTITRKIVQTAIATEERLQEKEFHALLGGTVVKAHSLGKPFYHINDRHKTKNGSQMQIEEPFRHYIPFRGMLIAGETTNAWEIPLFDIDSPHKLLVQIEFIRPDIESSGIKNTE